MKHISIARSVTRIFIREPLPNLFLGVNFATPSPLPFRQKWDLSVSLVKSCSLLDAPGVKKVLNHQVVQISLDLSASRLLDFTPSILLNSLYPYAFLREQAI